jgi:replication-associated recombination protein RarA
MKYFIEEIYKTEGVPEFTFIKPPNYNEILVDIRTSGKPVIIEGQSGTGKTTIARKIIEQAFADNDFVYLSARKPEDIPRIVDISEGKAVGQFVIDDFHRLDDSTQEKIANIVKLSAEYPNPDIYPKIVIIGINKVGSELIFLVHDIAKRCGIHRVLPANAEGIANLIKQGEERLNIRINDNGAILNESSGDYWLAQLLCQSVCMMNDVIQTCDENKVLNIDIKTLRLKLGKP